MFFFLSSSSHPSLRVFHLKTDVQRPEEPTEGVPSLRVLIALAANKALALNLP